MSADMPHADIFRVITSKELHRIAHADQLTATTIPDVIALWAQWNAAIDAETDAALARAEAAGRRLVTFDGFPVDDDDDDVTRVIVIDYRTKEVLLDISGPGITLDEVIDRAEGTESWISVDAVKDPVLDRFLDHQPVLRLPGLPDSLCDLIGDAVDEWTTKNAA